MAVSTISLMLIVYDLRRAGTQKHTDEEISQRSLRASNIFFQRCPSVHPHAGLLKCVLFCVVLLFTFYISLSLFVMLLQTDKMPTKLQYDSLSCSGSGQLNSSDLFTVDMRLIPLSGQLEGTARRHSHILHTKNPERVLLGSLWESGNHRLILLPIIGWTISEQDGAYVAERWLGDLLVKNHQLQYFVCVSVFCHKVPVKTIFFLLCIKSKKLHSWSLF